MFGGRILCDPRGDTDTLRGNANDTPRETRDTLGKFTIPSGMANDTLGEFSRCPGGSYNDTPGGRHNDTLGECQRYLKGVSNDTLGRHNDTLGSSQRYPRGVLNDT
jgi:hypothetical protein